MSGRGDAVEIFRCSNCSSSRQLFRCTNCSSSRQLLTCTNCSSSRQLIWCTDCSLSRQLQGSMSNSYLYFEQRPRQGCLFGTSPVTLLFDPGPTSKGESHDKTSMPAFPAHTVEGNPTHLVAFTLSHMLVYMFCGATMVPRSHRSVCSSNRSAMRR